MAEHPFPRSYYFTTLRNCSGNCHTKGRGSRKLMQHLYAQLKITTVAPHKCNTKYNTMIHITLTVSQTTLR